MQTLWSRTGHVAPTGHAILPMVVEVQKPVRSSKAGPPMAYRAVGVKGPTVALSWSCAESMPCRFYTVCTKYGRKFARLCSKDKRFLRLFEGRTQNGKEKAKVFGLWSLKSEPQKGEEFGGHKNGKVVRLLVPGLYKFRDQVIGSTSGYSAIKVLLSVAMYDGAISMAKWLGRFSIRYTFSCTCRPK